MPNPGRMTTCAGPVGGFDTCFDDPKRKYAYRLDAMFNGTCWIGVNPQFDQLVRSAIKANKILTELLMR